MRCIVRPRQNPADFLRDWGATTVQADLGDPTSLPATLVGIHTVIDCATARPEEPSAKIDWEGKKSLIQCAQVGDILKPLPPAPALDNGVALASWSSLPSDLHEMGESQRLGEVCRTTATEDV